MFFPDIKAGRLAAALLLAACGSMPAFAADNVRQASKIASEVKHRLAPDSRQAIYSITCRQGDSGRVVVDGVLSEAAHLDSLEADLRRAGIDYASSVSVLPSSLWAMPRISVACLRTGPAHSAEMASQALMGMPLRVLEKNADGDWLHVQTPDGYIAWVTSSSIIEMTPEQMDRWRRDSRRLVVTAPYQGRAYTTAKADGLRDVVTDLVPGDIVEGDYNPKARRIEITLPDGRKGWADPALFTPIDKWAAQSFDPDVILDQAYSLEGTPYLWGGTSVKSLDCSGLAKVSYLANGIILMRDASQQALTGTRIEASDWRSCRPGDLLFFGNADTGRVTHVAIYDHDGNYVHSSGRVKRNSVDPDSESYLTTPFLHAVRIDGNIGSRGITSAASHPWYFVQDAQ